ncbi:glycerol uptake facilitator protein [Companilactobacillus sp. RD055328]|uniref:MIP/aquaporin family protein n=1 Tax=Companilactobacillus sp. RD055328 TaxID=2916634 RepID=UPI001FC8E0A1|nr:MIP/aquaporin family protein [Companilactobacillus sp. RD055328]GKQ43170.1 glycerol uptake facilitator protein [Companilactobacillus sp. RD055328]
MDNSFWTQLLGEFIGTAVMILLGNGVIAGVLLKKSKSFNDGWMTIAVGWGLAVTFGVYAANFMSLGVLNPAVSLGLVVSGELDLAMFLPYAIAQLLGAMFGAFLVWLQFLPHWDETEDSTEILTSFSTVPAIRNSFGNFISEFVGTFALMFLFLAMTGHNEFGSFKAVMIGMLIFSIVVSLGGTTGYALNPARDLGPRIMHAILPMKNKGASNWSYSWIPIVAPIAGAVSAALIYKVLPI